MSTTHYPINTPDYIVLWHDVVAYFLPNIYPSDDFTAFYEGKRDENALYRIDYVKIQNCRLFEINGLEFSISKDYDKVRIRIQDKHTQKTLLDCVIKNMEQLLNILDIFIEN